MAIIDFHILAQSLLYFFTCISGVIVAVTTGVNRNKFDGSCILYATFTKDTSGAVMHSSDVANCEFPVYYGVFGMTFYGLLMGCYYMYAVYKSRRDQTIGSQMWVMPFLLLNVLLTVVTIVVACMVSIGFAVFCDHYLDVKPSYSKCADGQNTEWRHVKDDTKFNPGYYVNFMSIAMFGAWAGVLIQLIQVALGILRFRRNKKQRGMAPQRLKEEPPSTNAGSRTSSVLDPSA